LGFGTAAMIADAIDDVGFGEGHWHTPAFFGLISLNFLFCQWILGYR